MKKKNLVLGLLVVGILGVSLPQESQAYGEADYVTILTLELIRKTTFILIRLYYRSFLVTRGIVILYPRRE